MWILATLALAHAEPTALTMPTPQTCVQGLFAHDPEFAVYEGLSFGQIRDSLDDFQDELLRCVSASQGVRGTVEMQINVGCDGVIDEITVIDSSGLQDSTVSCVTDTLSYTPFPAHDTPEGVVFLYPMTLDVPPGAQLAARP